MRWGQYWYLVCEAVTRPLSRPRSDPGSWQRDAVTPGLPGRDEGRCQGDRPAMPPSATIPAGDSAPAASGTQRGHGEAAL
ncbi:unnamed protein product [Rangifer tarandus platyrhynchus]|uniref:Uncharacterized protein n=1 Tax=Rangifer tarandus platyrhynchus TaxID=3082113 RepID=A0ACB1MJB1_RANTA